MLFFANLAAYQVGWLASVLGAARGMPWLGPLVVALALAWHLRSARKPFDEALLVVACTLVGAAFDSALVATGLLRYPSGLVSSSLAPYWIVTLWMLFATTMNVSLRWLRGRPGLAASCGLFGGPAAYVAGQALGGVTIVQPVAAILALAIGWAVMMPMLLWIAENLDGMPGRRRNWIAERP